MNRRSRARNGGHTLHSQQIYGTSTSSHIKRLEDSPPSSDEGSLSGEPAGTKSRHYVLTVRKLSGRGGAAFSFEIRPPRRRLGSIKPQISANTYLLNILEAIDCIDDSSGCVLSELEAIGSEVYCDLPGPVKKRLGTLAMRERGAVLQIVSDEVDLPWEILRIPKNSEGGSAYLCEAVSVSRWIRGEKPLEEMPLRRMVVVASEEGTCERVGYEVELLKELRMYGVQVDVIPARRNSIYGSLASGAYDCWHFAGGGAPDASSQAILLDDETLFEPRYLLSESVDLQSRRPLIFLNACYTSCTKPSLLENSGWAYRILRAKACAFLGAQWAIDDRVACDFARSFYSFLLNGIPVAEAVRLARFSVKKPNSTTWLSYTLYAHPLMRVVSAGR